MINVEARTKSSDPIQESLREKKAVWNKKVSEFIDNLIHVKKMMNGFPSKFHMERSKITEPLPKDPGTILGVLASDFRELVEEGNSIISEQILYSKNRRKKQPNKQLSLPFPTAAFIDSSIIINASSPLSRFISHLKGPWFESNSGEYKKKKFRLSVLSLILNLYKLCDEFQAKIVESGPNSVIESQKLLLKIEDLILQFRDSISLYSSLVEKDTTKDVEEKIDLSSILNDFNKNYLNFKNIDINLVKQINSLQSNFEKLNEEEQKKASFKIIELYKELLSKLNSYEKTNGKSLEEILSQSLNKSNENLNVKASNVVKKWLGRTKHKLDPFDKSSSLRLLAYDNMEDMRNVLDKIMDSLEKDFDVNKLNSLFKEALSYYENVRSSINVLIPESKYYEPYSVLDKNKDKLQDLLRRKQMRQIVDRLTKMEK
jgi:hypothetical protein